MCFHQKLKIISLKRKYKTTVTLIKIQSVNARKAETVARFRPEIVLGPATGSTKIKTYIRYKINTALIYFFIMCSGDLV